MGMSIGWDDVGDWLGYSMIPGVGIGVAAYELGDDLVRENQDENSRSESKRKDRERKTKEKDAKSEAEYGYDDDEEESSTSSRSTRDVDVSGGGDDLIEDTWDQVEEATGLSTPVIIGGIIAAVVLVIALKKGR